MINYRFRNFSGFRSARRILLAFGGVVILAPPTKAQTSLPPPQAAGFEHVVVVMMENRSFGHFLGWLPGANPAGTLPNVAYIDPRFKDEGSGTSGDDHPHADIRNGEAFLNEIYDAVRGSPDWPKTVLIINFDEWGGFYDHVPPPLAPIPPVAAAAGDTDGRLGFLAQIPFPTSRSICPSFFLTG